MFDLKTVRIKIHCRSQALGITSFTDAIGNIVAPFMSLMVNNRFSTF